MYLIFVNALIVALNAQNGRSSRAHFLWAISFETATMYLLTRPLHNRGANVAVKILAVALLLLNALGFSFVRAYGDFYSLSMVESSSRSFEFDDLWAGASSVAQLCDWRMGMVAAVLLACLFLRDRLPSGRILVSSAAAVATTLAATAFLIPLPTASTFLNFFTLGRPIAINARMGTPVKVRASADRISLKQANGLLAKAAEARKNILFIVLESVGSTRFFDEKGQINSEHFPSLALRPDRQIRIPYLYAPMPSTTASHLALMLGEFPTIGTYADFSLDNYESFLPAAKGAGFATGLFSSINVRYGGLDRFYRKMGYDRLFLYQDLPHEEQRRYTVNTWGWDDFHTWEVMREWLSHQTSFFGVMHVAISHNPYVVPRLAAKMGDNLEASYRAGLNLTDELIDGIFSDLAKMGKLDDTVVMITGDHGEAFSEFHPRTVIHSREIFEENVRSFLAVFLPDRGAPLLVAQPYSNKIVGQFFGNYFQRLPPYLPEVDQPILFFSHYQGGHLGVRDGKYKLIHRHAAGRSLLFDLKEDPHEQVNLADKLPDLTKQLREQAEAMYLSQEAAFRRQRKL